MLCPARPERIQGSRLDQDLQRAFGHLLGIYPFAEIEYIPVGALRLPFLYDRRDRLLSNTLDRSQSKGQLFTEHSKLDLRAVHVRWQHPDLHPAAIVDMLIDPLRAFHPAGEQ